MEGQPQMQTEVVERQTQRKLYLSSRRPPRNDAVAFIENQVTIHDQQPLVVFSERAAAFVSLEEAKRQDQEAVSMWEEANDEIDMLFDLMAQVQAKSGGSASATGMTSRTTEGLRGCTWKDVMAEVEMSVNSWRKRPSRDSKVVGLVDKVGQNSQALEAWIQLLPTGDYGASICGVFKLAINAASQHEKIQAIVLETLSEIPDIMDTATRYVQIYHKMPIQILQQRTYQLFRAILKTLRLVMQFFLDGKLKKLFGTLIKQDSYGSEISSSIDEIKKCVDKVNTEADLCSRRQTASIGLSVEKLCAKSEETSRKLQLQEESTGENKELLLDIAKGQKDIVQGQRDILQALYGFAQATSRQHQMDHFPARRGICDSSTSQSLRPGYDAANVYHGAFDDDEDEHSSLALRQSQRENREARTAAFEKLRETVQYDREVISRDIMHVIREGHQLSYRAKSRAAALINDHMFKEFMTITASTYLLVNGREDRAAANGISPLSLTVAQVLSSIGGSMAQVYPLSHFCNSRRPGRILRKDNKPTAYAPLAEMAASLVGQLLNLMGERRVEPDIPSIVGAQEWTALGKLKVKTLIKTLGALVVQLPPDSIVICAIDDVGEYEMGALSAKLQDVMRLLTQMTEAGRGSVIFKLLVTCSNRALYVGRFFGQKILELEEDIEEDTAADWTISNAGEREGGHSR